MTIATLFVLALILIAAPEARATDLKDRITLQVDSVGLHPGMDPGLYVCGSGHLHIKGTVHNLTGVPVGAIKVGGKAFDADGKLLGTASATTKQKRLAPGDKAEINVEFLTVTGPMIQQVKRHELTVIEAPAPR